MSKALENVNILSQELLPTPRELAERIPMSGTAASTVQATRDAIDEILARTDPRLFVVVGPCSIHDLKAATEYAERLRALAEEVKDTLLLVMRVYFEKPRTSVGWKGFINDPRLDDSFHIEEGLAKARQFLLDLGNMGIGVATEALDPITPQYLGDLIAWSAIGARTSESQTHRDMASGLSCPVGFKNGTDGNIDVAINALKAVTRPQHFLGVTGDGQCAVFRTRGNRWAHLILRGGARPNYDSVSVAMAESALEDAGLAPNIVIDCSHGNSLKQHEMQPLVLQNCVNQIRDGNRSIIGFMLESHLHAGRQNVPEDLSELRYGVSITDACMDWETTRAALLEAAERLRDRLAVRTTS
ncbi:MAG TPA: 3-deoxy-7-phosphoheptulonate synthase [Polyangiaceae bacterium]|nr:3-deoxy-7-phosphoheptulonate synthase [Polyangiaceae bacterium]